MLRSLFLLDDHMEPDFRRERHRVLSQGESVDRLQRAIIAGRIEAKRGRNLREVAAISVALILLTNIAMAWNTAEMQTLIDHHGEARYPPEHRAHIAPVTFRHINIQDKLHLPIETYGQVENMMSQKAYTKSR